MKKPIVFVLMALLLAGCEAPPPEDGIKKTHFFKGGPLRMEQTFKGGQLNGLSKTYYKSGVVRSETNYKNGQLHGTMKRYAPNGNLAGEAVFENGKQVSEKRYL